MPSASSRLVTSVWSPAFERIIAKLDAAAEQYAGLPLLSLTHGQPATPTTLGKELAVYVYRLNRQRTALENQEYMGKINGATGTFGAHYAAVPRLTGSASAGNSSPSA